MTNELIKVAAANLKKAVPLMMKHQIPTTPINYALWYTYVGETSPKLNEAMNNLLEEYDTCPPSRSELLYREYVSDPLELDVCELQQNMTAMAIELSQSIKDTNRDADMFTQQIQTNFAKLSKLEEEALSLEQVMDLVRTFLNDSEQISSSTNYFSDQLKKAASEINELKQRLEQSERQALHDPLTGALNRRAFDMDLNSQLNRAPEGCCMIMVDIDHFKNFNDNFGHLLGDQVLKSVTQRLTGLTRNGAKIYRYGGEEFAILLPNSELRRARHMAESMRRNIEKLIIRDRRKGGTIDSITASFGVSQWNKGMTATQLLEQADSHLYQAKSLGRNRVMPITN